jgi:integrase
MLTDKTCRAAVCPPGKSRGRFTDSGGLYLEVTPAGTKRWFYKYRKPGSGEKAGKLVEARLQIGNYPALSLALARTARDKAKSAAKGGIDPVQQKQAAKLRNGLAPGQTLAELVALYLQKNVPRWSATHAARSQRIITADLLPALGRRKMADIDRLELIAALRPIEKRGTLGTLDKAISLCSAIWKHGANLGLARADVAASLAGAFTLGKVRHHPAIIEPVRFGQLLRHIRAYHGGPVVAAALQLAPLVFQRPGELRAMAWAEVDLEAGLWVIPAARMKRTKDGKEDGAPHAVPLSRQAVAILRRLQPITGSGALVFPGERRRDKPMSENSLRVALMAMGFPSTEHTAHGFRASARTMLAERLGIDPLVIEAQLAHTVKDSLGTAYNRTQYVQQRVEMMQQWSDYCDTLAAGNVFDLQGRPLALGVKR